VDRHGRSRFPAHSDFIDCFKKPQNTNLSATWICRAGNVLLIVPKVAFDRFPSRELKIGFVESVKELSAKLETAALISERKRFVDRKVERDKLLPLGHQLTRLSLLKNLIYLANVELAGVRIVAFPERARPY
jgi:hypothetical protein